MMKNFTQTIFYFFIVLLAGFECHAKTRKIVTKLQDPVKAHHEHKKKSVYKKQKEQLEKGYEKSGRRREKEYKKKLRKLKAREGDLVTIAYDAKKRTLKREYKQDEAASRVKLREAKIDLAEEFGRSPEDQQKEYRKMVDARKQELVRTKNKDELKELEDDAFGALGVNEFMSEKEVAAWAFKERNEVREQFRDELEKSYTLKAVEGEKLRKEIEKDSKEVLNRIDDLAAAALLRHDREKKNKITRALDEVKIQGPLKRDNISQVVQARRDTLSDQYYDKAKNLVTKEERDAVLDEYDKKLKRFDDLEVVLLEKLQKEEREKELKKAGAGISGTAIVAGVAAVATVAGAAGLAYALSNQTEDEEQEALGELVEIVEEE